MERQIEKKDKEGERLDFPSFILIRQNNSHTDFTNNQKKGEFY